MEHISIIPDYRQAWKVEHKLSDILLLTICAVISGAEGWEDIEDFGKHIPTQQCIVWSSDRSRRMRNPMRLQPFRELLNMMDIKGKIITTDAMGCQKDIAEKIQKQGGDYLFAVKGNQGRLNKAFEEKFPLKELNNPEHDSYAMSEKSHGREEIRLHIVCDVPDELIDFTFEWKGLKKLCVAVSFRSIIAEQKKEPEIDGQILYQFC